VAGDELRNPAHGEHDFFKLTGRQLVKILDTLDLGDQQEPGKQRVVFQQHAATTDPPDFKTAGGEAGMDFKCHAGMKTGATRCVTPGWQLGQSQGSQSFAVGFEIELV
jgi:hypothetical protein